MTEPELKSKLLQWLAIKGEADALEKARVEEGPSDRQKREIRQERKDAPMGPTGTTENFSAKGKMTPIGVMQRWANVRKLKAAPNPNLPKSELDKGSTMNLSASEDIQKADQVLGRTKSGKDVFVQAHPTTYSNFTNQDHSDAKNLHYEAAETAKSPKMKQHHLNRTKQHMQFGSRNERFGPYNIGQKSHETIVKSAQPAAVSEPTIMNDIIRDNPKEINAPVTVNAYKDKK